MEQESILYKKLLSACKAYQERTAIIYDDQYIDYELLWKKIAERGEYLKSLGIKPGHLVALHLPKGLEQVYFSLALFALGAGFSPIPFFDDALQLLEFCEKQRFNFLLNDERLTSIDTPEKEINSGFSFIQWYKFETKVHCELKKVVYICYTSGTTGQPKGVMISKKSLLNTLIGVEEIFPLKKEDRIFSISQPTFDLSIYDIFAPFIVGAAIVIPTPEELSNPHCWLSICKKHSVTIWNSAPALFSLAAESNNTINCEYLRRILLSGDWLPVNILQIAKKISPACEVVSLGGATEATIWSIYHNVLEEDKQYPSIPYGFSLPRQTCILLDDLQQEIKLSSTDTGILYLGGESVAEGYWLQENLSKEKFITHSKYGRLYKTDDRARYLTNGELLLLGRSDNKIKVHGLWIDLQDIQQAILKHPQISAAHVFYLEELDQVFAAIVSQKEIAESNVNEYLQDILLIKNRLIKYIFLPSLPLTFHGKINTTALESLAKNLAITKVTTKFNHEEFTSVEKLLHHIWVSALKVPLITREDDFFRVGGTSFKAFRLIGLINQAFSISFSAKDIFNHPKFSSIAKIIESRISTSNPIFLSAQNFKAHRYKATPEQTRLFLLAQNTIPGCYNLPILLKVTGELNKRNLQCAIKNVIAKVDVLRAHYLDHKGLELAIEDNIDDTQLVEFFPAGEVNKETLEKIILKPIDSFIAPLWRIAIWPSKNCWEILLVFHHALLDGYSAYMLAYEILEAYENISANKEPSRSTNSVLSYKSFKSSKVEALSIDFWKNQLANLPILSLPTHFPRLHKQTYKGKSYIVDLTEEQKGIIKSAAKKANVTTANYLLAHFLKFLSIISGQQDIITGVNFSDRDILNDVGLYGFKMHTQLLRMQISSSEIGKLAHEVQTKLLIEKEKYVPLYKLLKHITFERKEGYPSLFQVLFSYLEVPTYEGKIQVEDIPISYPTSKLDLTLYVFEYSDEKIVLNFEYATDLFSSDDIKIHADDYVQQLINVNDAVIDCVSSRLTPFWQNTECYAEKIAVTDADTSLTYAGLGHAVRNLSEYLKRKGVVAGCSVAINLPRDHRLVVSLLAVLACGAHFIPMSLEWPKAYQEKILKQANPQWLIAEEFVKESTGVIPGLNCNLYSYSQDKFLNNHDLAYIIFTSGSTGDAKGVEISYLSLERFFLELWERLKLSSADRFAAITALTFDISLIELLLPLFYGASTSICSFPENKTPDTLAHWLSVVKASVLQTTPSFFKELLRVGWKNKENAVILCGGEAITHHVLENLLHVSPCVWNLYGPTETTIWSSTALLANANDIHIGQPLNGVEYHIQSLSTAEIDNIEEGELLISGWNLSKGYLNNPQLSQQQFINIPSLNIKAYKTGDLVRKHNGKYYYLGRIDRICKVRGNRVSLPAIEEQLAKLPLISESAVINKSNDDLCAILVPKIEKTLKETNLGVYYFGSSENYQSYDDYLRLTQYADQLNFDSVWFPERHFDSIGGLFANPAILAGAFATATKRIKIYAGSVVSPLHNTLRIAEDWAMVNELSGGRAGLALASGWHSRDFVLAPNVYSKRKEYLIEQLHELRKLWRAESVKRLGGDQKEWLVSTFPKLNRALPLWLSLASDRNMFREAALQKINILTHLLLQSDAELSDKISLFRGTLAAYGEDIHQYKVTLMVHAFVHPNAVEIARPAFKEYLHQHVGLFSANHHNINDLNESQLLDYLDNLVDQFIKERTLIGTPEECWSRIKKWSALGVDQITCLVDFGLPVEEIMRGMEILAKLNNVKVEYQPIANYGEYAQAYLNELIPSTWLPNQWQVRYASLPLTLHGKIDYLALNKEPPSIEQTVNEVSKNIVLTPTQEELRRIWGACLKSDDISINQHFYALGGHSLLLMQVIHEIAKKFSVEINFLEFISAPTIVECARLIESKQETKNLTSKKFLLKKYSGNTPIQVTISQKQILALQEFSRLNSELNDVVVYKILGPVDESRLSNAINILAKDAPSLRTTFGEYNGQLCQIVHPYEPIHVLSFKASNFSVAMSIVQLESKEVFLGSKLPLIKFILIKISPEEYLFSVIAHHLINDGWSMRELLKRLGQIYDNPAACDVLAWNMLDYSYSENLWLQDKRIKRMLDEWYHILKEQDETLGWPYKNDRGNFKGDRIYFSLNKELAASIKHFSNERRISVFECLLACYSLCIFSLIPSSTIVCAVPFANREIPGAETIIGNLVNLLPIPIKNNKTFEEQLNDLKQILLFANSTQFLPLPKILSYLAKEAEWSTIPKVHVGLAWQNIPDMDLELDETKVSRVPWHSEVAYLDLLLVMEDFEETIQGYFAYNANIFSREQLVDWLSAYTAQLTKLVKLEIEDPVVYLPKPEQVVFQEASLYHRFASMVSKYPDVAALINGHEQVTYTQLLDLCDQATSKMLHLKWQPGARILLLCSAHQYSIAFILALWRINANVLWLEPDNLPLKRIEKVLNDIQPFAIVYEDKIDPQIFNSQALTINIDNFFEDNDKDFIQDLIVDTSLPAYMIYTSGTLGYPKCPVISQASLSYIIDQHQSYGWKNNPIVAQMASLQFDVSILEIWGTLLLGGTLVLIPYDLKLQPYLLEKQLLRYRVNTLVLATKVFQQYIESWPSLFSKLETVLFGGEKINLAVLNKYIKSEVEKPKNLLQGYGLSETTIVNTIKNINGPCSEQILPLGKAIPGVRVFLLDEEKNLLFSDTPNKIGEIIVGGPTVCMGFMINGQLTQTQLATFSNEICYKTGDLGYWNTQGELIFIERKDRQVKINGKRVDLLELEVLIKQHSDISDVAIVEVSGKIYAYIKLAQQVQNLWNDVYKWFYEDEVGNVITWPNFSGWTSAITRKPLPHKEMIKWLDDTIALIQKLKPKRILEIGVGSGNIAHALASQVQSYIGIDMAEPIITWLEKNFAIDHTNCKFLIGNANHLQALNLQKHYYDVIIFNSTIQYFPDINYLKECLTQALNFLTPDGALFLGDIRDPRLLGLLEEEMRLAAEELNYNRQLNEEELLVHPRFFIDFAKEKNFLIGLYLKAGTFNNELSRYRYDVIMKRSSHSWSPVITIKNEDLFSSKFDSLLMHETDLLIENISNARLDITHKAGGICPAEAISQLVSSGFYSVAFVSTNPKFFDIAASKNEDLFLRHPDDLQHFGEAVHYEPKLENKELLESVKVYCQQHLPEYMVPQSFIAVPEIPLTNNGKTDYNALKEIKLEKLQHKPEIIQDNIINQLRNIFSLLLNVNYLSIDDNLFDYGLDSISLIHAVAKAKEQNIVLSPREVMRHPTIRELVGLMSSQENAGTLTVAAPLAPTRKEEVFLSPAQQFFFRLDLSQRNHWNLAMWVGVKKDIQFDFLREAISTVCARHPGLQMRFKIEGDVWKAEITNQSLWAVDKIQFKHKLSEKEFDDIANKVQAKLNIESGPLLRLLWVQDIDGYYLLVVVHHLWVDSISLSLILSDLEMAVSCLEAKKKIMLLPVPTTLQTWLEQLQQVALKWEAAFDYWKQYESYSNSIRHDTLLLQDIQSHAVVYWSKLSKIASRALLQAPLNRLGIPINAVFLAALGIAFYRLNQDLGYLLVNVDSHGRHGLPDGIGLSKLEWDLSRTIGWLTAVYPVKVDMMGGHLLKCLNAMVETMEELENYKLSFGVLSYMGRPEMREMMRKLPKPKVGFNYFGKLFQNFSSDSLFYSMPQNCGIYRGLKNQRLYEIEVNGFYKEDHLEFRWEFNSNFHEVPYQQQLMSSFLDVLEELGNMISTL